MSSHVGTKSTSPKPGSGLHPRTQDSRAMARATHGAGGAPGSRAIASTGPAPPGSFARTAASSACVTARQSGGGALERGPS